MGLIWVCQNKSRGIYLDVTTFYGFVNKKQSLTEDWVNNLCRFEPKGFPGCTAPRIRGMGGNLQEKSVYE
jgi:hypothetical protein